MCSKIVKRIISAVFIMCVLLEQSCSQSSNISTPHSSSSGVINTSPSDVITVASTAVPSNQVSYHYSIYYLRGSGQNGKWNLGFYQLDTGTRSVRDTFNHASRASVVSQLDFYTQPGDHIYPWDFTIDPKIVFTSHTVSEELRGIVFFQGAAHPWRTISTVVIDTRDAHQLRLSDIFINENQGLKALSVLAGGEFTKKYHMPVYPPGVAPQEDNFKHWIPIKEGLRIIFEDEQLGHGQPAVIIPWSKIEKYLKPEMRNLGN